MTYNYQRAKFLSIFLRPYLFTAIILLNILHILPVLATATDQKIEIAVLPPVQLKNDLEMPQNNLKEKSGIPAITTNDNIQLEIKESNLPSYIGNFKGWHLLTIKIYNRKICYTIKYPFEKVGNHTDQRNPYIMISYITPKKQEVSLFSDYDYRLNSNINVSIDGNQTVMKAGSKIGWSKHQFDDFIMIDQMLSAVSLKAKAESAYGTYSIDIYNLEGFREMYQKMVELCQPAIK